jgi:ACR3 family arsenite transporter
MTRATLERRQLWIYLAAIGLGLALGASLGPEAAALEALLWPVLALLLFATFTQVPLIHLPAAFRDGRFMAAALVGNFLAVPVVVAGLLWPLPDDPAIRLGVLLVLLVPCTDWFVTFSHLSGGDAGRAVALTPVNLILQIVLLPLYLWLILGEGVAATLDAGPILAAFGLLILLPLAGAWALERWSLRRPAGTALIGRLAWAPVPLLALVMVLIAASQVEAVQAGAPALGAVTGVFLAFLVLAVALALLLARLFRLPDRSARVLVFALGTRNSFVVLPLALALPAGWSAAAVVIVLQSLVELLGMLLCLWLVPRLVPRIVAR